MAAWNKYAGARVSESGPGSSGRDVAAVPKAEGNTLTAQTFFKDFVAPRKPLLVRGHLSDESWTLAARWNLAWFEARAGPERVKVEVRDPAAGSGRSFGQGREVEMPVEALCKHVREGGEALALVVFADACPTETWTLRTTDRRPAGGEALRFLRDTRGDPGGATRYGHRR